MILDKIYPEFVAHTGFSDSTYKTVFIKVQDIVNSLNSFKFVMNWVWYSLLILFYIALVVGVAILTKDLKITSIISIVFLTILITVMSQI